MLHAYRRIYPLSQHALPMCRNMNNRTLITCFGMPGLLIGWWSSGIATIGQHSTATIPVSGICITDQSRCFDHTPMWQDWLPEYRPLIVEVQAGVRGSESVP